MKIRSRRPRRSTGKGQEKLEVRLPAGLQELHEVQRRDHLAEAVGVGLPVGADQDRSVTEDSRAVLCGELEMDARATGGEIKEVDSPAEAADLLQEDAASIRFEP